MKRIVSGAVLTTLLGVGAELAAPENRQDGNRIVIAGRDSAQDSINQVGQEITRRNMNIQPTLTARPGLPVRIIVNRDLVLRPYQPLFFNRELRNDHDQEAAARASAQDRECQADLRLPGKPESRLDRYASLHAQAYGEAVDAEKLIPHMLEAFMAGIGDSGRARRPGARHRSRHDGVTYQRHPSNAQPPAARSSFWMPPSLWAMMTRQARRSSAIQHDTVRCGFSPDALMWLLADEAAVLQSGPEKS